MSKLSVAAGMILLALHTSAAAENAVVEAFPPVVVRTSPAAGNQGVDPSIREIRVTFSKEMMTHEMWSFVYARPAAFPKVAGQIHYLEDKRTCVLPVSLEPGKTYGVWINSQEHTSFRDTYQNPAVPYLLIFKTRN
jgi:RNA polymerase sigma-70 factor (ECF subfamily)